MMFTISVRVTKKQILAAAAVFVLALAGGVWARSALAAPKDAAASSAAVIKVNKAPGKTNEQRVGFLESFGWQVEPEETEILEMLVPDEPDEVFARYNEIQKQQGCDLTKYGGKRCKRYTYEVLNYPGGEKDIRANILVYNGRIIGGDICSLALDGFMHGFAMEND